VKRFPASLARRGSVPIWLVKASAIVSGLSRLPP